MEVEKILDPEMINTYLIPRAIRMAMALVIFIIGRWIATIVVSIPYPQRDVHLHNVA